MHRSTGPHNIDKPDDNDGVLRIRDAEGHFAPVQEQTKPTGQNAPKKRKSQQRANARRRQREAAKNTNPARNEPKKAELEAENDPPSATSPPSELLRETPTETKGAASTTTAEPLPRMPEPPHIPPQKKMSPSNRVRDPSPPTSTGGSSRRSVDDGGDEETGATRSPLPSKGKGRRHSITSGEASDEETAPEEVASMTSSEERRFDQELWDRMPNEWVLTLSMHFRDGSQREKFFITYIREPNKWLRVSVSIDYNNAVEGSLEYDLQSMSYQRDKNFGILKAVWHSLNEIKFFDTITNLKLETLDGRLHIHVAEDANERIPYPLLSQVKHLKMPENGLKQVRESEVFFDQHLSGYVYRVRVHGELCVKKEITSIDTVEEFLYEIEALAAVLRSRYVINLVGIVKDEIKTESGEVHEVVTGLLLEYASGGPLNDYFFDHPNLKLDWNTKMTWIRQVVEGMNDIHEAGKVQGDCTLSNVVLDSDNNARVCDINRRGCPIGWEPPEFNGPIFSGRRISMLIGVKSDLYQMGMVVYGIADQQDEPDRSGREYGFRPSAQNIPEELTRVLDSCLAEKPEDRKSAKELLTMLKPFSEYAVQAMGIKDLSKGPTREDIVESQRKMHRLHSQEASEEGDPRQYFTHDQPVEQDDFDLAGITSASPAESEYDFGKDGTADVRPTSEQEDVPAAVTSKGKAGAKESVEGGNLTSANLRIASETNRQMEAMLQDTP